MRKKKVSFATSDVMALASCMTFSLRVLSSTEESCGLLDQISPLFLFGFIYLIHTLLHRNIDEETLNSPNTLESKRMLVLF